MGILVGRATRVVVQGITGREGLFHTQRMLDYGTQVVGGVTPGKGGEWAAGRVPVFDTCKGAVRTSGANTSVIYVPPQFAADAIFEAVDAGISLIVCITEGIPVQDMMRVRNYLKQTDSRLVGPNCPGLLTLEHYIQITHSEDFVIETRCLFDKHEKLLKIQEEMLGGRGQRVF